MTSLRNEISEVETLAIENGFDFVYEEIDASPILKLMTKKIQVPQDLSPDFAIRPSLFLTGLPFLNENENPVFRIGFHRFFNQARGKLVSFSWIRSFIEARKADVRKLNDKNAAKMEETTLRYKRNQEIVEYNASLGYDRIDEDKSLPVQIDYETLGGTLVSDPPNFDEWKTVGRSWRNKR